MRKADQHIPELDWLKGFSIILVVCIHAELWSGSFVHRHLIDRAVLIFLVLFGISSELWWQREESRSREARDALKSRWRVGRLKRIYPAFWAMMAVWWAVVIFWQPPEGAIRLDLREFLTTFIGYAPAVGTSWFVTMIVFYILVFPYYRRFVASLPWLALPLAAAATFWSGWKMFDVVDAGKWLLGDNLQWPGWYYHWIFPPRVVWHVTAGILVARWWGGRLSKRVTAVFVVLAVFGGVMMHVARGEPDDIYGPIRELATAHVVDVALALALLGLFRWTPLPESVRRFLAWCGQWSWGIYLGHLLVHEILAIARIELDEGPQWVRAVYVPMLLAAGSALSVIADRLQKQLGRAFTRRTQPASS